LDRALVSGTRGRGFKSHIAYQSEKSCFAERLDIWSYVISKMDSLPGFRARATEPKGGSRLRRYETILIAHVDLSEDELSSLITRYGGIVTGQKGILVKVERWGKRRLAYLIRKQARGFYILIDYAGVSAVVNELERNLKIDDKILKFMTVLKAETVDVEALRKEIAEAAGLEEKKAVPPATSAAETVASGATEAQPAVQEDNAKGEKDS
jgi:small subunit ribosomal protein S6